MKRTSAFHGTGARDERENAVHPDHAQQKDNEHCAGVVWSHDARAGRIEAGVSALWCDGIVFREDSDCETPLSLARFRVFAIAEKKRLSFFPLTSSVFPHLRCSESRVQQGFSREASLSTDFGRTTLEAAKAV